MTSVFRSASGSAFVISEIDSPRPAAQCPARTNLFPIGFSPTTSRKTKKPQQGLFCFWRRGWDSNPRTVAGQRFSRPPLSTTQPPLRNLLDRACKALLQTLFVDVGAPCRRDSALWPPGQVASIADRGCWIPAKCHENIMFFKLLFVSGVIILSEPVGIADVYTWTQTSRETERILKP